MAVTNIWNDEECPRCGENGFRVSIAATEIGVGKPRLTADARCGACGLHHAATLVEKHDNRPFVIAADDTPDQSESMGISNAPPAEEL